MIMTQEEYLASVEKSKEEGRIEYDYDTRRISRFGREIKGRGSR